MLNNTNSSDKIPSKKRRDLTSKVYMNLNKKVSQRIKVNMTPDRDLKAKYN